MKVPEKITTLADITSTCGGCNGKGCGNCGGPGSITIVED